MREETEEEIKIKIINFTIKMHIVMFLVYSCVLIAYISVHMFTLSDEMALCENNASRYCPLIYDSGGIVNNPNPNASVSY